ncbi:MAG: hypothetical protein HY815_04485 [Candidatus Riflebacteria bacterium]|nr:hypothetical protein [Candidatus Riflebacteria bacterium]
MCRSLASLAVVAAGFLGLALAARGAEPIGAGQPSPRPIFTTERINLPGALQKVAYDLFKPPRGTFLTITKLHDHWRIHDRASFEKYEVASRDRGVLGTFVRMRCFPGGESTVDLAVQIERGRVVAVEPIQPVIIRGTPFLGFPAFWLLLSEQELPEYAEGLSRIFQSLVYLGAGTQAAPTEALSKEDALILKKWLDAKKPQLAIGASIPPFEVLDERGAALGSRQLAGSRSLVFVGTLLDERAREVLSWLARYVAGQPDRFTVVVAATNGQQVIDEYRRRGGTFPGPVVTDTKLVVYNALRCHFTPAIFAFDPDGRLVKLLEPVQLTSYDRLQQELDPAR